MKNYITTKNGGLFIDGQQLMMDEVPGYESEIEIARIRQIARQKSLSLAQIFLAIEERLKGVTIAHKNGDAPGTAKKIVEAIIEAIELEGIFMSVSQRGYLLMDQKDVETPLKAGELGEYFQKLIDAIDPRFSEYPEIAVVFNGKELFSDYFLPRLRAY